MQFWLLVWEPGNFREHETYGPFDTAKAAREWQAEIIRYTGNWHVVQTEPEANVPDTI